MPGYPRVIMSVVEGWLVLTPKKHVYFYSEHCCDPLVLELPWSQLEEAEKLSNFLNSFNLNPRPHPVDEIVELKVVAQLDKLKGWFEEHSPEQSNADPAPAQSAAST